MGSRPRAGRPERGDARDPAPVPRRREGARRARLAPAVHARRRAAAHDRLVPPSFLATATCSVSTTSACRSCGGDRPRCRSCRSAARRWRTRCSPPTQLDGPSRRIRSTSRSAAACALVQITETVPPEVLFRDYLYFSSFSDTMLRHARELAERLVRRAQARAEQPRGRDREQRRLPAPVLQATRASRCSGIEPARNIARGRRRAARHPDASRSSSTPTLAAQLAGEGRRADVFHAQQRARARRRPQRLRRRHPRRPASRRRRGGDRGAVRQGHARPLRVRHDLPRAPLLLLAHRARRAVPAARARWSRTSSGCRSTAARCGCSSARASRRPASPPRSRRCSRGRGAGACGRPAPYRRVRATRRGSSRRRCRRCSTT